MPSRSTETADVLILCGGAGTRLRSVVPDLPKPMASIDGHPFLEKLVLAIMGQGFRRVILCTGYRSEEIENHFRNFSGGGEVVISREDSPLGTGGAVRLARPLIRTVDFLVYNGDTYSGIQATEMLSDHRNKSAMATIAVSRKQDTAECGSLIIGEGGRVTGFLEKSSSAGPGFVNSGIYAFRSDILARMPPGPFSLERDLFPGLSLSGELYAYHMEGDFIDIGTPERYLDVKDGLPDLETGARLKQDKTRR